VEWIDREVFKIGTVPFTSVKLLTILSLIVLLQLMVRLFFGFILRRLNMTGHRKTGSYETVFKFAHYLIVFVGTIVILQSNGVDLSALTMLTSAVGLGIGFGLQSIANNLISGVILLFERPIKVGDRIEVKDVQGRVVSISLRATTILTNDNISVVVPNSSFITGNVTNWTLNDPSVRLNLRVGVSYKSEPTVVRDCLLNVAKNHIGVLESPGPDVMLEEFGESAILFNLRIWTRDYAHRPGVLRSELNFAIFESFRAANIQIPFPQLDLHVLPRLPVEP
jgi:small-conductance mechanosensitive channel